jgi:hypothetical protein
MCGTKSRPRAVIKAPGSASIKNGEEGAGGGRGQRDRKMHIRTITNELHLGVELTSVGIHGSQNFVHSDNEGVQG